MKEDARPLEKRVDPAPAPAEREDVRLAVNRCPFCHEDVAATERAAVVCQQCLARHHESCWSEAGACGSCRGRDALVPKTTPPLAQPVTKRSPWNGAFVLALLATFLVLTFAFAFRDWRAREKLAFDRAVQAQEGVAHTRPDERSLHDRFGAPLVANGQTLLVTDGKAYGVVVFASQTPEPEGATLAYRVVEPGGYTYSSTLTNSKHGGFDIKIGSLKFQWSGHDTGSGYVYATDTIRFALVDEPLKTVDPTDPKWVYHDANGNEFRAPPR